MLISFYADVASGASIVLLQASLFTLAISIAAIRKRTERLMHTHV
jgi:ABC-type Mn2+/Zn2+ transport system permease subunit